MANMRVEQLSEIAFASPEDGIREDFIVAARAELDRRGDASETKIAEDMVTIRSDIAERASLRLGWFGIVLTLIVGPLLLLSLGGALSLYLKGYKTKASGVLICIPISLGLYVLAMIVI